MSQLQRAGLLAVYLNPLADAIHELNAKFWLDLNTGERIIDTPEILGTKICLMHSELSEMLEGVRKGTMDSHLPHRLTEEVEAADVLIRLLDYCARRNLDVASAVAEKLTYNAARADHKRDNRLADGGKKF